MNGRFATIALVAVLSLPALQATAAEQATDNSIRELMALTGAGNLGVQVMQNMLPALKQLVPQAPESFWTEVSKEMNPDEIVSLIVPIYRKHFTEDEIQETLAFYRSPTGRKVIQTLPQVMQESMAAGQQWGQMLAQRVLSKAKAKKLLKS